jgi:hypothetical protein
MSRSERSKLDSILGDLSSAQLRELSEELALRAARLDRENVARDLIARGYDLTSCRRLKDDLSCDCGALTFATWDNLCEHWRECGDWA